jgi:hypothetical protein
MSAETGECTAYCSQKEGAARAGCGLSVVPEGRVKKEPTPRRVRVMNTEEVYEDRVYSSPSTIII